MEDKLLRVEHVSRYFGGNRAVEDVSFSVRRGEAFGLVGESGSGKTTLGRCILGLQPLTGGKIYLQGQCIRQAGRQTAAMKKGHAAAELQMIFQDPMASLDPRMTVGESVAEGLVIRGKDSRQAIREKVERMLALVGLPASSAQRYPHQFSGGQRQRVGIARALIMEPQLLIADEPVSALDVSVQAQVINLLSDLRQQLGLTVLFIAHDLSVVKYFCTRVAVMHMGKLVELADTEALFQDPRHPYTRSLLSAIPVPDPVLQRQRTRLVYEPLPPAQRSLREWTPGHWVYCSEEERQIW